MADKIQFLTDSKTNIPTLAKGEPYFADDTKGLYVGTGSENVLMNEKTTALDWSQITGKPAVAIKDGTLQTNLNADMLDGTHIAAVAIKDGTVQTNLNADMLDGMHTGTVASNIPYINSNGRFQLLQTIPFLQLGTYMAISVYGAGATIGYGVNFYLDSTGAYHYLTTHTAMGARGFILKYSDTVPYYFTMGVIATTADATFTPTLVPIFTSAGGTINNKITFSGATAGGISYSGSLNSIEIQTNNSQASGITFHRPSSYAINFGLDTDNQLKIGGYSMGSVAYTMTHAGNLAAQLAALPNI